MVDAIAFPRTLLREQSSRWSLRGATIAGGQTGIGALPRISIDGGGTWQAQYDGIVLRTPDHVRRWRQYELIADAGVQPLVIPMCDARQAPQLARRAGIPHSDGEPFSDGAGYSQPLATIGVAAALRATTVTLHAEASDVVFAVGQFFSVDHLVQGRRLYGIRSIESQVGLNTVVTIRPPLRQALAGAEAVILDDLGCVMVLQAPDSMNLTLGLRRFASPSITAVEYFYSPA
jgi:hypothetical protein